MRRAACLLVALALLTGCWSRREITETAFAGIMAVDWVAGRYRVSVNILMPMGGGPGQGGGGGKAAPEKPVWTIHADAAALDEAVGRLERLTPRRLFLAHIRAVLFGEELVRRGIGPALDFLSRSVEIRPTAWIGVTPGLAADLLNARPTMEAYPANGPLGYHDLVVRRTLAPAQPLAAVVATLAEEGTDLALPAFRAVGPGGDPGAVAIGGAAPLEVLIAGAAVFRGDRLVAWLEAEAARGVLWATGRAAMGPVAVPCPEGPGAAVFRLRDNETRTRVRRRGASAAAHMRIRVVADANEVQCRQGLRTPAGVARLESALAAQVRREVEAALAVGRAQGADIFALGQALYRSAPADYRALEADWPRVLARMPVEITVQARIPRAGQIYGIVPMLPRAEDRGR